MKYILSVLVENKPGVLSRVTGLISDWPDLAAGVVEEYNASHGTGRYLWQGEGLPAGEMAAA